MKVVHCRREPYTVYIGRGSVFGNPFTHLPLASTKAVVQVASLEASIAAFEEWLDGRPKWRRVEPERRLRLLKALDELSPDDVLGCYCRPAHACHGDVIAARRLK